MPILSAIIIARNEERDLPACLESLWGVADEIVLVDSHSTDRTRDIAASFGARVIEKDFAGFGPQKQFALSQATGDWVINLDADERLSPALRNEIPRALAAPGHVNGFFIPFRLFFFGRRLRFGGAGGERHLRLFRRARARYDDRPIHEGVSVEPSIGCLRSAIHHESYRDFDEYLTKCNRYTALIARNKHRLGKRYSPWRHGRLPWEFFVRYVVKLGFLDGDAGFIYAVLSAYYAWLKNARLRDEACCVD